MVERVERFDQLGFSGQLLKTLDEAGYEYPAPIQVACAPALMAGSDLIAECYHGSGKTLAYLLPLLERINLRDPQPQGLILTPTHEMSIHVAETCLTLARHLPGLRVLPLYGGHGMVVQMRQIERGVQIVVGTPRRVVDHVDGGDIDCSGLRTVILDGVDEMMDIGFSDDIAWVLDRIPGKCQKVLFANMLPPRIRLLAERFLHSPAMVALDSPRLDFPSVHHRYWQVNGEHKLDALTRLFEVESGFDAGLVFVRTRAGTEELAARLEARGYGAAALHGMLTPMRRRQIHSQFRQSEIDILVVTDSAAPELEGRPVSHVIHYDLPCDLESYAGRVRYLDHGGHAIMLVAPRDVQMLHTLEQAIRQPIPALVLPERVR